ncbi:hypothetical protein OAV88_03125 [bacterium]|nr:hypothetical protein [bacterium]
MIEITDSSTTSKASTYVVPCVARTKEFHINSSSRTDSYDLKHHLDTFLAKIKQYENSRLRDKLH